MGMCGSLLIISLVTRKRFPLSRLYYTFKLVGFFRFDGHHLRHNITMDIFLATKFRFVMFNCDIWNCVSISYYAIQYKLTCSVLVFQPLHTTTTTTTKERKKQTFQPNKKTKLLCAIWHFCFVACRFLAYRLEKMRLLCFSMLLFLLLVRWKNLIGLRLIRFVTRYNSWKMCSVHPFFSAPLISGESWQFEQSSSTNDTECNHNVGYVK